MTVTHGKIFLSKLKLFFFKNGLIKVIYAYDNLKNAEKCKEQYSVIDPTSWR